MGRGIQLIISNNAQVIVGENFNANANCIINASHFIQFGDNCLVGWNSTILDSDGHRIIKSNEKYKDTSIYVGSHVWLCSGTTLLKGVAIGENSVVAANSTVTKQFTENSLLIGNENRIIEKNISWVR